MEGLELITVVFLGASIIPFFSRKLKLPSATLEIIFGFVVFNFFLKSMPSWFPFLQEIGLVYLMFIAGMELELKRLKDKTKLFLVCLILGIPFLFNPFVAAITGLPPFTGVATAVISAGIVIPVLKEMKLLDREGFGENLLIMALLGEVISIMVLTLLDIYHKSGLSLYIIWDIVKLLILFIFSAIFLRVLYFFSWWYSEKIESVMESEDPVEEGIRAIVAIAFTGALIAYFSGIEPILGSFITGAIFSHVFRSKGVFYDKINALGFGFFIPVFFIGVGAELDLSLLHSKHILWTTLLVSLMPFIGRLPIIVLGGILNLRFREALLTGLLLSSPLTMMVVAASVGYRLEFIDSTVKGILIIAAIVGSVVYPFIFRLLKGQRRSS